MSLAQIELLLNGITDESGEPLSGGKVYTYVAGTTTEKPTYAGLDGLTLEENPIILDGAGRAQAFADGTYKFVIKDADDATLYTYDNLTIGQPDSQFKNSGTSTGSANAYVLTNDIPSTSYNVLDRYYFIANFSNTGVATVNIDGLGTKTIQRFDNSTLQADDILSGSVNELVYNGTDFLLATSGTALSASLIALQTAVQTGSPIWGGTSDGSANAQTITLSPVIVANVTGMVIRFKAGYTNTAAVGLSVNGIPSVEIFNQDGASLSAGEILLNSIYEVIYDGAAFRLISPKTRSANQSFFVQRTTVTSTSSTSITAITSMSQAVTVKVGDIVMVTGDASMSHSTIYGQAKLAILKGGVAVTPEMTVREHDDASTAGRSVGQSVNYIETVATAGTYTFALGWETNTGTVYCEQACMSVLVIAKN